MQGTVGTVGVGDCIEIVAMFDEPRYKGKIGVVKYIDDMGQLHGTWGGCAVIPDVDEYRVIKDS